MDWTTWRDEFPGLEQATYLNSCSLGALARTVRGAIDEHLDAWEARGASAWYDAWMAELADTRARFARLIGAHEHEVALMPNVSTAMMVLASGLELGTRPKVVATEMDFPTITQAFHARDAAEVALVESPDGITVDPAAIQGALDERTAALVTNHVFFTSGAIQDITRLTRAAHQAGALSIIDAYQATGQVPTDVEQVGCDVLIAGGLKWLLGGTGIVYLYVSEEAQEKLSPETAGWFGDVEQFNFDATAFNRRPNARGLELGTPGLPSVFAGNAGMKIVEEIGVPAIRDRQTELLDDLWDRLTDLGFELATPPASADRAGILMVVLPDPADTVAKLADRGIIVDHRPGRLRISPYFYNTIEETQEVAEAVLDVEAKAHRR